MKKIIAALLMAAMLLTLVACNAKTEPGNTDSQTENQGEKVDENTAPDESNGENASFDYMAADLSEYIKLGNYKGLTAHEKDGSLSDDEFNVYVESHLSEYQDYDHITDRVIEEGDVCVLDYSGAMDGVKFDGGTATNQSVTASDNSGYIPGFGSGLIGHMPGEEFSVDVTFPDPYENNPDMSGKVATFTFTVHYIQGKELIVPTLDTIDDGFVKEKFGVDSVEEFLKKERASAELMKSYIAVSEMNDELWQQILNNTEVIKYPEGEVESLYEGYKSMYEYYASYYGVDYNTFLANYVGMTDLEILEMCRSYVKDDMVLFALTKELDAKATEEEVSEKINYFSEMHGWSVEDTLENYGEESLEKTAQYDKVMKIVAGLGTILPPEESEG